MACVDPQKIFKVLEKKKKPISKIRSENDSDEWTTLFPIEQANNTKRIDINYFRAHKLRNGEKYPELVGKKCIPGKLYRKGCQKCFCDDQKFITCGNATCEKQSDPVRVPEDVGPPIPFELFDSLPVLEHEASECEPGKTYKVDCNACKCLYNKNLLCTRMLCISPNEVNRIEAAKLSGKPCENDVEKECVQCVCTNGKQKCKPVLGCLSEALQKQLKTLRFSSPEHIRFDIADESEKCIPGMVYKFKCNNCYCQDDMSLRCTRKGCLNYTQIKQLEKQRDELLSEEDKTFRMGVTTETNEEKKIIKKIQTDIEALEKLAHEIEEKSREKTVPMDKSATPYIF